VVSDGPAAVVGGSALVSGGSAVVGGAPAVVSGAPAVVGGARARARRRAAAPAPARRDARPAGVGRGRALGRLRDRRILAGAGSLAVSGALSGISQLLIASGLHGDGVSTGATGLVFSACAVAYIAVSCGFLAVGARGHTPAVNVLVTGLGAVALLPALVSSTPGVLIAALLLTAGPRGALSVVAYSVAGSATDGEQGGGGAVFGLLGGAWSAANVLTPLGAGALAQHAGPHVAYLAAIVPSLVITAVLLAALPGGLARPGGRRARRPWVLAGGGGPVAVDALQPAELLERDVTADPVPRLLFDELRLGRLADLPELAGTARLERAPRRGMRRAGDLALEPDAEPALRAEPGVEVVEARHR
jgi:hypothetical protein